MIAGDPGIGKTRLASELARAAHAEGAAVLLGRCHEELLISYQPFVEAIGRYAAAVSPEVLRSQLGTHGDELARLVPDLAERLAGLPVPAGGDADGQRFRLFEAAGCLIANAALARPVLLVLEDLHWADKPTALMLAHVVRSIQAERVLVLGTYRETELGEPLGSVLADLRRDRALERLRLGSLHRGDVATMISAWLGRTPPTHFAHALHRETEGNPFFIEEVLRHLIEVGAVDATEWGRLASFTELGIPDGVRDAIERRLATLGPATRRILTMAAAIGRSFSIDVLEALAGTRGERLFDALEEAAERRIIEGEPGAPTRFAFAHALIRETLYASLSGPRRVALHRRIGAILEQRHGGDPDPPYGELAYHFVQAAEPGAAAKAVDFSTRAAQRALAALAYEEAAGHFGRALEALELSEAPDERTRCELMLGLGESHGKASEFEQSRAALEPPRTSREPRAWGRTSRARRSASPAVGSSRAPPTPRPSRCSRRRWPRCPTPTRRSAPGCSAGWPWSFTSPASPSAVRRLPGRASRSPGGCPTRRRWRSRSTPATGPSAARTTSSSCSRSPTRSSAARSPRPSSSWPSKVTAGAWSTSSSSGQTEEVDDEIAACATLAERLGQPFYRSWVAGLHPMRALMQGRFDEAERLARDALAAAEAAGNWNGITASRVQLAWCWKDVGDAAARAAEVERFVRDEVLVRPQSGGAVAMWHGNLALFMAEAGLHDRAQRYLDRVAESDDAELTRNVDGRSAAALAAEACALLGDARLSRRLYELLLPRDGLCILGGRGVYFRAATARYLGLLAATLDRKEDAVRHLEDALETNTRAQAPPWIARTLLELARALLARGAPGDARRAADLLREAELLAHNLGMQSLAAQVTHERSATTPRPNPVGNDGREDRTGRIQVAPRQSSELWYAPAAGVARVQNTSERVFADLLEAVVAGRYAPGEKLPRQRELAADLGVTLQPLREALKRLEQMGVVEARHGDATRVRDWRAHGTLDVLAHLGPAVARRPARGALAHAARDGRAGGRAPRRRRAGAPSPRWPSASPSWRRRGRPRRRPARRGRARLRLLHRGRRGRGQPRLPADPQRRSAASTSSTSTSCRWRPTSRAWRPAYAALAGAIVAGDVDGGARDGRSPWPRRSAGRWAR